MHDIDRSFTEMESEGFEYANEADGEVFSEGEVEELASELLSVSNESELDQFLGDLIKKAGKAVGKLVRSPLGRSVGGMLKGVAKTALPMAGAALGNMVLPGIGGMVGGNIASAAGSAFGLELEGLSDEDAQFELSKQFVRLAGDATKTALAAAPSTPAVTAARDAMVSAAQKFAPGLLQGAASDRTATSGTHGGRWVRRGNKIVIYGV